VAADALALVAEINPRHFELFLADVFPHVHFRPVGERKDAHVLARIDAGIEKIPDFRPLVFRVPLSEAVAKAEEPFLCAGLFLVAPRAANQAIKLKFLNGRKQRGDLQLVAADFAGPGHGDALGDGVFDFADDEFGAEFLRAAVTEFIQFREMMAGVHVQQRHRDVGRAERLFRQAQKADGILATGKQQGRPVELRRDFTHDVNRLGFEILQMIQVVAAHRKGMASGVWDLGCGVWGLGSGVWGFGFMVGRSMSESGR